VKSLFGSATGSGTWHRPCSGVGLPPNENRLAERILAEEDVQRILAAETEPRDRILVRVLYAAGLRVSEACGLLWRNLHARGEAGQITVFGKNGRTRAIALPVELWSELAGGRGTAARKSPCLLPAAESAWTGGASV